MADLREAVVAALYEQGIGKPSSIIIADAVLAAIRKDHAIVERVGEDVAEAAFRAAEEACRKDQRQHTRLSMQRTIRLTLDTAFPIIAAHARDAALEEAAAWLRAKAAAMAGQKPAVTTANIMATFLDGAADEMHEALKSGGPAHG